MIAVGNYRDVKGSYRANKKTELFSRSSVWSNQPDYPFGERYISDYSIVAMKDFFYVFGGQTEDSTTNRITSFSTISKVWKIYGKLKSARSGHGVFIHEGDFVIVGGTINGGDQPVSTERCTLKEDTIQCTAIKPKLSNYYNYPEMIAVPHDYCSK